jgi:DNA adenine methylase
MLKAPFPYFGGKAKIAPIVWAALGNPRHYIEPFFGSGAVLLNRPDYSPNMIETVNDKDGFVANVWRAIQFSPDETARWCDWPVNHADLSARKKELIKNEDRLLENLIADPEWHDPKMAGYWIWAASCWIGSGLTQSGKYRISRTPEWAYTQSGKDRI